ncbi:MAG: hypothetical protein WDA16_05190 [Candidatus Thermoplasmatota archaeon]
MAEPTKEKQPENELANAKRPEAAEKPNFPANEAPAEPEADEEAE